MMTKYLLSLCKEFDEDLYLAVTDKGLKAAIYDSFVKIILFQNTLKYEMINFQVS